MESTTVGDYLLDRLHQWGVDKVFAGPGDGINAIVAALGEAENQLAVGVSGSRGEIFS